jgi:hypothetical protein
MLRDDARDRSASPSVNYENDAHHTRSGPLTAKDEIGHRGTKRRSTFEGLHH